MFLRKNRNSIILATLFSAFIALSFCSQRQESNQKGVCSNNGDSAVIFTEFVKDTFIFTPIDRLEIPKPKPNDEVVSHTGYSFVYDDAHKQSNWVAYMLCKGRSNKVVERPNSQKFRVDVAVKTGTATHDDYTNSGYDIHIVIDSP